MGLDITSARPWGETVIDDRYGSYGRIHQVRKWVLEYVEGNPARDVELAYNYANSLSNRAWDDMKIEKCPALINHSDCDGGYISFSYFGIRETSNPMDWADLDKLREELTELKLHREEMPAEVGKSFDDFCKFVLVEDEDDGFEIVNFG